MEGSKAITKIQSWMRMCLIKLALHRARLRVKYQEQQIEKEIQKLFSSYVYIDGTDYVELNGERVPLFPSMPTTKDMFRAWSSEYKKQYGGGNFCADSNCSREDEESEAKGRTYSDESHHFAEIHASNATAPETMEDSPTENIENTEQQLVNLLTEEVEHADEVDEEGKDSKDPSSNFNSEESVENKISPILPSLEDLDKKHPYADIDWVALLRREEARLEKELLARIEELRRTSACAPHQIATLS